MICALGASMVLLLVWMEIMVIVVPSVEVVVELLVAAGGTRGETPLMVAHIAPVPPVDRA